MKIEDLAKQIIEFEDRNELTVQGTLNCMLLRLIYALERQNDLKEFELKKTLEFKPGFKRGIFE